MKRAKPAPKVAVDAWLDDYDDRLLTTDTTAKFLGYTSAHLRKCRVAGEGPPYIVLPNGFSIRYRLGDLKAWAGIKSKRGAA